MHTILLLTVSNIFMTIAWYGSLKHSHQHGLGACSTLPS